MKQRTIILTLATIALILFILGLVPAEKMLRSDHSDATGSYVLIGTARAAASSTAVCEFALGALVAALWIKLTRNRKKTEPGP